MRYRCAVGRVDLSGTVLDGRYRVIEPVAEGAMGVVYRAERIKLGRIVAVKVLHESLPSELSSRKRFELEAMAMAKLEHPHCAAVVDVGLPGIADELLAHHVGDAGGFRLDVKALDAERRVLLQVEAREDVEHDQHGDAWAVRRALPGLVALVVGADRHCGLGGVGREIVRCMQAADAAQRLHHVLGDLAQRAHRRGDPDAVTIELVRHEGGVTVCAVYPSKRGDEPNSCAPGSRGHMNTDDNDTEVQFMIEVPAGVQCVPRTVNGDVSAQGLTGTVDAQTVNGSIDVETSGMVSAQTVNGSIRVEMGRLADDVEFSTVNGGITVAITGDVDATLRAATMNGSIESDFPVTIQGKAGRRSLQGTLGKGGPRIDLESVNGSLRLRRAGSSGTTSQ